jgi:hypothetical protein
VIECLPGKWKALSLNPMTRKKEFIWLQQLVMVPSIGDITLIKIPKFLLPRSLHFSRKDSH